MDKISKKSQDQGARRRTNVTDVTEVLYNREEIRANFPVFMKLLVIFLSVSFLPFVVMSLMFFVNYDGALNKFGDIFIKEGSIQIASEIASLKHKLRIQMGFLVVVFSALMVFGALISTRILVSPLNQLVVSMRKLAQKKYGARVKIRSSDEFGIFGSYFNKMSQQLKQAHDREQWIAKMKSSTLTTAAHQLRTPLNAIFWVFDDLLSSEKYNFSEDQRTMIEKGKISSERMLRLISSLLNIAKIEEGRFGYTFKKTNISKIIREASKEFAVVAKIKNVQLAILPFSEDVNSAYIDSEKIKIVLSNLVGNALEYTPSGGKITISAKPKIIGKKRKMIAVSVKDTGVGIPKEEIEKLFTMFFRGRKAMEINIKGAGLGLFISENIIKRHGGDIHVTSKEGEGSTFTFTVPVVKEQVPIQKSSEQFIVG